MLGALRNLVGVVLLSAIAVSQPTLAKAERGFLGMQLQGNNEKIAAALGLDRAGGVLIRDISLDGPAGVAGFARGDLIVEFAGVEIDTFDRLVQVATKAKAGDKVAVKVMRQGQIVQLDLAFGKWLPSWLIDNAAFSAIPDLGITFSSLTPKVRERFGIRWGSTGIVITKIEDAISNRMALRRGDVISQINQQPIWMPDQIVTAYQKAKLEKRAELLLLIERSDGFQFIMLPVPVPQPQTK